MIRDGNPLLVQALLASGLLPPDTRSVELLIPTSGALVLRYEVFLTEEALLKIGQAFLRAASPSQEEAPSRAEPPS